MISKKKQAFLKELANKSLLPFGLELHRKKGGGRVRTDKDKQATAGHIVEFLGPSAIGKNTIFNKCKHKLKYPWNYDYDASKLGDANLDDLHGSAYRGLLWSRLGKIRESPKPISSETETVINIVKRVQADISMRGVEYTRGFFLREGLFAYFTSDIEKLDESQLQQMMSGRSFVIILPDDTETAVTRFLERIQTTGKRPNYFAGMSPAELYDAQERAINAQRTFGLTVESMGRPVLWLKAEDDIESNARKVIDFERVIFETVTAELTVNQ